MSDSVEQEVVAAVSAKAGITLAELLDSVDDARNDIVFNLLLTKQIYTDLTQAYLDDQDQVHLFLNSTAASFYARLARAQQKPEDKAPRAKDLLLNTTILLDGNPVELLVVGKTDVILKTKEGEYPKIGIREFEKLIREGQITGYQMRSDIDPEAKSYREAMRRQLTDEQMLEAIEKEEIVKRILDGERVARDDNEARKYRYWVSDYQKAKATYGNGLVGLMPKKRTGNKTDRLAMINPTLRQRMTNFISEKYEKTVSWTKSLAYGLFRAECEEQGIKPPSMKTFRDEIKKRAGAEQTKKMEGSKAAYQVEEHVDDECYTTPVEGDRPWEYAHVDHTEMDVLLRHSKKKTLLRKAWITVLIDSFSRKVLAHYVSFDKPSRVAVMGVIRDCVRRHGRLPETIVVDRGAEFKSIYFQDILAYYNCNIEWRPPTKPRFGAIIERFIGTLNKQLLHNLEGNTKIMKRARQVTNEVNPKTHAVWNLPLLDEELEKYLYEEYDKRMHAGLGRSPNEEFEEGLKRFNVPEPDTIEYGEAFKIDTMLPSPNETAKVTRSRGIKVYGTWYKARVLRDAELIGTRVKVKIDWDDVSHVFAYARGRWVECFAPPKVFSLLRGKSVALMRAISIEERELNRAYGRASNSRFDDLAFRHAPRIETERVENQRLCDEERKEIEKRKGGLSLVKPTIDEEPDDVWLDDDGDSEDGDFDVTKIEAFGRMKRG